MVSRSGCTRERSRSSVAQSEHALYDERFVTFGEDDVYQQSDAAGFIRLYSLPDRVRALRDQELAAKAVAPVTPAEDAPVLAGTLAGLT